MSAAPSTPFPGFSVGRIDDEIVNPELYESEAIHDVYARLRREDPVHWTEPKGFRPFWSVTKHPDILEVEKNHPIFVNRLRTYLSPVEGEEWVKSVTGDTHLFRTLRRSRRSRSHEAARADAELVHAAEFEEARGAHRRDRQGPCRPHGGLGFAMRFRERGRALVSACASS